MNAQKIDAHKGAAAKWISLILRLAFFSMFGAAAVNKFVYFSPAEMVDYFTRTFASGWLPMWWVTFFAWIIPYLEAFLAVWLLTGFRLRAAWVVSSIYVVSLGFGLMIAQRFMEAGLDYLLLLLTALGLYTSPHDKMHL